jgi:hypothetical protein
MLLAVIGGLLPGPSTRLPHVAGHPARIFGWHAAFHVAGPLYGWASRGAVQRAYVWGAPLMFLSGPLRLSIGKSELWRRIAEWLAS